MQMVGFTASRGEEKAILVLIRIRFKDATRATKLRQRSSGASSRIFWVKMCEQSSRGLRRCFLVALCACSSARITSHAADVVAGLRSGG
jgi:hypothetical protein